MKHQTICIGPKTSKKRQLFNLLLNTVLTLATF